MMCAADLRPTAAETAAALVFTTDGYSDDDGVDHVTAAVRSVAAAEAQESEWDVAEAEYLRAAEASDDASALEMTATTDLFEAHRSTHSTYLEARSRLMRTIAPHWAAIATKADAFLRRWGDDETSRYAKAARSLAETAAKIGNGPAVAADQIEVISARGAAEQLCYYLAQDDDGYRAWAVSLGSVGEIAFEAEAMASETRQLARANDALLAVSAAVVGAVWFSEGAANDADPPVPSMWPEASEALILSMCLSYGAPEDVGPATSWHDVGTDLCRLALLDEIEGMRGVGLTDDERESVRTVSDLIALAGASLP